MFNPQFLYQRTTVESSNLDITLQNYIDANGQTDTIFINAWNTLLKNIKLNGYFTKLQFWHVFYSDAIKSKFNILNPIDSDTAFRLTYEGTGIINNSGFQHNGIDSYADTHFVPSVEQDLNSNGFTIVIRSNNIPITSDVIEIGSYNSGGQESAILTKRTALNEIAVTFNGTLYILNLTNSIGVWTGQRHAGRTKLWKDGVLLIDQSADGILPFAFVYIGALSLNNTPYGFSNQLHGQVIAHSGFEDSEIPIWHSLLQTAETAIR